MKKAETFAQKLSSILEKKKIIQPAEVEAIQKAFRDNSKELFDEFLLEEGLVDEEDLLKALSEYYKVPSFDVVGYFFDYHLVRKFPKGFLLREGIIPVEVDKNILSVAVSDPSVPGLESKIREYVSYDITFMVGIRRQICDAVKEFYERSLSEVDEDLDRREKHQIEAEAEELEDSTDFVIKSED